MDGGVGLYDMGAKKWDFLRDLVREGGEEIGGGGCEKKGGQVVAREVGKLG